VIFRVTSELLIFNFLSLKTRLSLKSSVFQQDNKKQTTFARPQLYVRELVINNLLKFSVVIFSLDEAKNAAIALATASIAI